MVTVPVKTRDLATVMGIAFDKRELMRRDPTEKTKQGEVAEHLANVAEKLAKMVEKIPDPVVVDGEFKEVPS
jgi:hypothetical protein